MSGVHLKLLLVFEIGKLPRIFKRFPEIPFPFSMRSNTSWHIFSKVFEISKNISLHLKRSEYLLQISSKEIGLQFLAHSLSLCLWRGTKFLSIHISRQWTLYGFKWLIILAMPIVEEIIESRDLFVSSGILSGKSLLLFNRVYWSEKNESKKFKVFLEVCYELISMKNQVYKEILNQSKIFLIRTNTSSKENEDYLFYLKINSRTFAYILQP